MTDRDIFERLPRHERLALADALDALERARTAAEAMPPQFPRQARALMTQRIDEATGALLSAGRARLLEIAGAGHDPYNTAAGLGNAG